ncbi:MAG: iron ABC transporter permease [Caldisericia bacterium]|jgi:iron complex transport system permease protein|nr:iron ABC transporter permease [Caldisericia bacterium]
MIENSLSQKRKFKNSFLLIFIFLIFLNLFLFLFSLSIGRYSIKIGDIIKFFLSLFSQKKYDLDPNIKLIIFDIRLPRILISMLVGSSLSISGLSLQGIFNNPLISPYILGISGGAGFGAALGVLIGKNFFYIEILSFIFGILSVFLTIFISGGIRTFSNINLVLSGFIVGTIFQSLLSLVKYYLDPLQKLPTIVFWLMGSFNSISKKELTLTIPIFIMGIILIFLLRWKLNIISLGDEEAISLGENPKLLKGVIIVLTTILTATSVSISGIIGWVGLAVPHIGRFLLGSDFRKLVPFSILFGSFYLLLIDNISRTLTPSEIPIGILTSLIGAPIFIYVLKRRK